MSPDTSTSASAEDESDSALHVESLSTKTDIKRDDVMKEAELKPALPVSDETKMKGSTLRVKKDVTPLRSSMLKQDVGESEVPPKPVTSFLDEIKAKGGAAALKKDTTESDTPAKPAMSFLDEIKAKGGASA